MQNIYNFYYYIYLKNFLFLNSLRLENGKILNNT